MALKIKLETARVISVHEEPTAIEFYVPNVHPGRYEIPGIDTPEEKVRAMTVEHRKDDQPVGEMLSYASVGEKNGIRYIMLEVVEAVTYNQNPAQESHDRFGVKKVPDILSVAVPIRAVQVANEIERAFGPMGIIAIEGDEPTDEELSRAMSKRAKWERSIIMETNKWYKKLGDRQVTDQARRVADRMYRRRQLPTLPEWALVNPAAQSEMTDNFHCICGALLRKGTAKCGTCQAIHDWPKALVFGLVKLSEVPPIHRVACGLPPLSNDQTPTPVPAEVVVGKKGKKDETVTAT